MKLAHLTGIGAIAAFAFIGIIGTAHATPDTSNSVEMWNLASVPSGNDQTETALVQQALPGAAQAILNAGGTNFNGADTTYSHPIDYNLNTGSDSSVTISQFFAANQPSGTGLPSTCDASCGTSTLSAPGWTSVTLLEFTFTTSGENFTVTHDDGVSLFAAGTEDTCTNSTNCNSDLLPFLASGPTSADTTDPIFLAAGTYDLWYTAANGAPEVLETSTVPVPAPPIGKGLPVILAIGGLFFGAQLWGRRKRGFSLETGVPNAIA